MEEGDYVEGLSESRGVMNDDGDVKDPKVDDQEEEEDLLGAGRASFGDDLETLDRRRTEELKLIGKFDSSSINPRRECWFLVDTKWLERWAKFVRGEGPPPGRITNEALVQTDLKTPVEGLMSKVDYRGVNPIVWFLYNEIYGRDAAKEICRYVIDIYEEEVPNKYRPEICAGPRRKAQVEVQKMRWRVEPPEIKSEETQSLCLCISDKAGVPLCSKLAGNMVAHDGTKTTSVFCQLVIDCVFMSLFTCCARLRGLCCCCGTRGHGEGDRVKYRAVAREGLMSGYRGGQGGEDENEEEDYDDEDEFYDTGLQDGGMGGGTRGGHEHRRTAGGQSLRAYEMTGGRGRR